ncbi:MAG: hypothetical protein CL587_14710 [Alteromonadaceae bacterium]|nr:hypothetical protein [Alteromonadaceae bacterium]
MFDWFAVAYSVSERPKKRTSKPHDAAVPADNSKKIIASIVRLPLNVKFIRQKTGPSTGANA